MLIYLAGLDPSNIAGKYAQAAKQPSSQAAILVSFFFYSDPSRGTPSPSIIPPPSEANHERQVNDES